MVTWHFLWCKSLFGKYNPGQLCIICSPAARAGEPAGIAGARGDPASPSVPGESLQGSLAGNISSSSSNGFSPRWCWKPGSTRKLNSLSVSVSCPEILTHHAVVLKHQWPLFSFSLFPWGSCTMGVREMLCRASCEGPFPGFVFQHTLVIVHYHFSTAFLPSTLINFCC